jgi:3-hydroxyisobutyrate dehydrogenase
MAARAGIIGLGVIGGGMAKWLLRKGVETTVFDVVPEAVALQVERGAVAAGSCRELAQRADVIGVAVRDDDQVREAVLGAEGALAGAQPGAVIALHSTIRPATVHEVARAAAARGVGVVDAPVTGGPAGAAQGTLCYMVGGPAELLERCRPVFEPPSRTIVHTGELGSASKVKLCNNLMGYLGFLAAYEADLLALRAGVSREALDAVTSANGVLTDPMRAYLGGLVRAEADRGAEAYQAYVRGIADLAEKDLALALELARESGVTLPGTALCQQLMARVYGLRDEDRR